MMILAVSMVGCKPSSKPEDPKQEPTALPSEIGEDVAAGPASRGASASFAARAATHCTPDERVIFSCPVQGSGKVLSICAARDLARNKGHLQYRFGALAKVELEFPQQRDQWQDKFTYTYDVSTEHIKEASTTALTFKNKDYTYVVYTEVFDAEVLEQGLRFKKEGSREESGKLLCQTEAEGNLGQLAVSGAFKPTAGAN